MGLFDSVYATCTCGKQVEFQTKAMRDPYMNTFPLESVPIPAANDLNGKVEECVCGRRFRLFSLVSIPQTVAMAVTAIPPDAVSEQKGAEG